MPGTLLSDTNNIARNVFLCLFILLGFVFPFSVFFPHAFREIQVQKRVFRSYIPVDATVLSSHVNTSRGSKGKPITSQISNTNTK